MFFPQMRSHRRPWESESGCRNPCGNYNSAVSLPVPSPNNLWKHPRLHEAINSGSVIVWDDVQSGRSSCHWDLPTAFIFPIPAVR